MFPRADFTYDETSGVYKAAQSGDPTYMLLTDVTLKFADGKLISATFTYGGVQVSITVSYGNATLTLPTVA